MSSGSEMAAMRCTQAPKGEAAKAAIAARAVVPELVTERLVLRAPMLEDLPLWTAIYMADFADEGDTEETAWTEFSYYTAGWMLHGHGLWTVTRRDGAAIGFALLGLEWEDQEPELGYMFTPDARGQGYATEAVQAVRDFGFDLLGPGQFVSYIRHDNAASHAVARRIGATRDAAAEAAIGHTDTVWRHWGQA